MAAAKFNKDPDAILDYGFDWTPWLAGDTIDTSTWYVAQTIGTSDSLTTSNPTFDPTGKTTVWLEGGAAGDRYSVTNEITTEAGRRDDRTLLITIRQA